TAGEHQQDEKRTSHGLESRGDAGEPDLTGGQVANERVSRHAHAAVGHQQMSSHEIHDIQLAAADPLAARAADRHRAVRARKRADDALETENLSAVQNVEDARSARADNGYAAVKDAAGGHGDGPGGAVLVADVEHRRAD